MSILTHVCLNTIYKYCNSTTQQILRNTYKFFYRYPKPKLLIKQLISDCNDDIEIIKWVHINGSLDKMACEWAARYGYLNILKWLHENGFPLHEQKCVAEPAYYGRLNCLKYAHENGCPLDKNTFKHAIEGYLDSVAYDHKNASKLTFRLFKILT